MSETPVTTSATNEPARRSLIGLVTRSPVACTGLVILALMTLMAVFAGVLSPADPFLPDLESRNAPPGTPGHLLGADGAGRDILSRLLHGSRATLLGALLAIVVAILVGVPTGLVAGYFGGRIDAAFSWFADVLLSIPGMVVLLAVIAAFGSSVVITMSTFGVVLSPHLFRLVRSQTLAVKNELYVDAARVAGLPDHRIVSRHILYVVRAPIIIQSSILAGIAVIVQSGLQFLGFSGSDQVSWGSMLANAFSVIYLAPTAMVWPGVAIGLTVASLALLGNGLRDAVQSSGRSGRRRADRRATKGQPATPVEREHGTQPGTTSLAEHDDVVLEVRDLQIGYPQEDGSTLTVVDQVNLTVRRGEVLGLVGESGSGKTQTAFAIMGLLPRNATVLDGTMTVAGTRVEDLPLRSRRRLLGSTVAYVPQEPMTNLDPAFKVGQQLTEPMRARGMRAGAARERALELLTEVGLPDPLRTFGSYPHQISGGMAQRVLIAGAISGDPVLLIADEPTTALDVTVQAEILTLLRRLQRDRDMAVLLVTHNLGVVADVCDSVTVMQSGVTVEHGDVTQVLNHPEHPYTRELLAANLDDQEPRPPLHTTHPEASATQGVEP